MNTVTTSLTNSRFQELLKTSLTKQTPFMGQEIEIRKLSTAEIMQIQKMTEKADAAKTTANLPGVINPEAVSETEMDANLNMLMTVIRMGAVEAKDITAEEFRQAPLGELAQLSEEIMAFSGLGDKTEGK